MAEQKTMKITVVRYRPEQDDKPWEQTFDVPYIHLGLRGSVLHQGSLRAKLIVPLVLPYGRLRFLRHDG